MSKKKAMPEQWALTIVGFIIALVLVVISFLPYEQKTGNSFAGPEPVDPWPEEQYASLVNDWATYPQMEELKHEVFRSRYIGWAPANNKIEPILPETIGPDKIQIEWKIAYNLSLEDSEVKNQDADNDGFTNGEEYANKTNPRDPVDRPSPLYKVEITNYEYVRFRMIFKDYSQDQSGKYTFQINLLDAQKNKSRLLKLGDKIEDYVIQDFRKKVVEKLNPATGIVDKYDSSELDLLDERIDEILTLVKGTERESNESWVELKVNVPNMEIIPSRLNRGKLFTLDGEEYKLVSPGSNEASQRKVMILPVSGGDKIELPMTLPDIQ
ncbi:MAG: Amuc_1099 family pilus-like system protein [Verrucomicrobiota bacterium]